VVSRLNILGVEGTDLPEPVPEAWHMASGRRSQARPRGRAALIALTSTLSLLLGSTGCVNSVVAERRERAEVAKALFDEHCKKAGVFVHRTVKDVDGILVMKLRPNYVNYGRQFEMDDPFGRDHFGEGYLQSFLRGSYQAETSGQLPPGSPPRFGYRYVEAVDPTDGVRYRYTGRVEEPWQKNKSYLKGYLKYVVDKAPAPGAAPRYGLTYDDISTRQDREYWIAGSSLRVVDTQTGEVLAERIGYMWDRGQGNNSGGRSPWLFAANNACPSFYRIPGSRPDGHAFSAQSLQALDFVESILIPAP
jgi:hypothetical protein